MSIRTMSEVERREYYAQKQRESRARKKQEEELAEQEANPTLAERLRKANPLAPETDEELVQQFLKVHEAEARELYFQKILRVHREMCPKLGIPDVQPGETLYSFTKRVIEAGNRAIADWRAEDGCTPITWNIQIPDRPIGAV